MSSSGRKSCPSWFFTFHPPGFRCGPQPCVYAVRGGAWRQTSTPHPNNGLLPCSPLLSRLIIRIVSQGEWGCNMSYKQLWGPTLNPLLLTLPYSHFWCFSWPPFADYMLYGDYITWSRQGNENTIRVLKTWHVFPCGMQINETTINRYHSSVIQVVLLWCFCITTNIAWMKDSGYFNGICISEVMMDE